MARPTGPPPPTTSPHGWRSMTRTGWTAPPYRCTTPTSPPCPTPPGMDMPAALATVDVDPGPEDATPLAVVVRDRAGGRQALVGPFTHSLAALTWAPVPPPAPGLERHVLPLHPAPPAAPPAWLQS